MKPIKANTIEEMAEIIAIVKSGQSVECHHLQGPGVGLGWLEVEPSCFAGNFMGVQYRRKPPTPIEVWLHPSRFGIWNAAIAGAPGAYHFIEVTKE